ncbi:diguanylate cyclase (GGDEF)-like protein [Kineococcus radiotolerans]|uniref:Diguanylate cyclase (GGDEF)-like protein n=1 Tax=Kineococcus radiotolerans TaxID=131568 RepID=A0A7W4XWB2_KINRA|nr:bifunctional diguanylate cyclase/phosphodiesterase [Kineococcus radiotolerans]MBB2900708.1 diguanylate cyclase (GGDEF)-like protein [Kineococcus radiotolerans]
MDTTLGLALLLSLVVLVVAVAALVVLTGLLLRTRTRLLGLERGADAPPAPETDPVTGLLTGAGFTAVVAAAQRGAAHGGHPLALLHLGLDGFRAFNSTHGRAAGDAVLTEVARRLRSAVRGGDEVGRLGGDEFAVLLADPGAAVDVAVRLLAVLEAPHEVGTARVVLGVSVGVAHRPGGQHAEDLLAAAEQAVAEAKAAGGGCVRVWDPSAALARGAELRTAQALHRAVAASAAGVAADPADGCLEVHYQPSVDVRSGVVSGVEALVRWRRRDRLVPPGEFIELAERHGVIADLGRAVLARSVADAPLLCAAAGRALVVAVNVSAPQLRDPALPAAVRGAVERLEGRPLVLELTENVLVAEDPGTEAALDALVGAGAHLTVDDFGTGYATLAYLRRRPFTAFKIDRSYVRDIESDPRTRALVEGLVLLASATGLGLVVEGVETEGQARLLEGMGAPTHQGFLHARPAPLEQACEVIAALRARLDGTDPAAAAPGEPVSPSRRPRGSA